jgi:hypothetical protein
MITNDGVRSKFVEITSIEDRDLIFQIYRKFGIAIEGT